MMPLTYANIGEEKLVKKMSSRELVAQMKQNVI